MIQQKSDRIPCIECGALILPITADTNRGLCGPCRFMANKMELEKNANPPTQDDSAGVSRNTLKLVINEEEFDRRQRQLLREMIISIKTELSNSDLPTDRLPETVTRIALALAGMIDGNQALEYEGRPLIPLLAFADDSEGKKLLGRPGGSFMQNYVHSTVKEIFPENG